jgi:hypothetical protein
MPLAALADIVDLDDVRMIEFAGGAGLLDEAVDELLARAVVFVEDLDRMRNVGS